MLCVQAKGFDRSFQIDLGGLLCWTHCWFYKGHHAHPLCWSMKRLIRQLITGHWPDRWYHGILQTKQDTMVISTVAGVPWGLWTSIISAMAWWKRNETKTWSISLACNFKLEVVHTHNLNVSLLEKSAFFFFFKVHLDPFTVFQAVYRPLLAPWISRPCPLNLN